MKRPTFRIAVRSVPLSSIVAKQVFTFWSVGTTAVCFANQFNRQEKFWTPSTTSLYQSLVQMGTIFHFPICWGRGLQAIFAKETIQPEEELALLCKCLECKECTINGAVWRVSNVSFLDTSRTLAKASTCNSFWKTTPTPVVVLWQSSTRVGSSRMWTMHVVML